VEEGEQSRREKREWKKKEIVGEGRRHNRGKGKRGKEEQEER
jgi:hypothetical protein